MAKQLGFIRTLRLPWLDAVASLCAEGHDSAETRRRLEAVVGLDVAGVDALRKTLDVLMRVWVRSAEIDPALHAEALCLFRSSVTTHERVRLHFGLCLLSFPLFRSCALYVGQMARADQPITRRAVGQRAVAELGPLGGIQRSVERVVASLVDWGVLQHERKGHLYLLARRAFHASQAAYDSWLLACALHAHPAEELPAADLLALPELLPFRFQVAVGDLRASPHFVLERQGGGLDMVRLAHAGRRD